MFWLTKLGLEDGKLLVLKLLVAGDLLSEELLERLGHLALADRSHVLDSLSSRREPVDSLQLEPGGGQRVNTTERASADCPCTSASACSLPPPKTQARPPTSSSRPARTSGFRVDVDVMQKRFRLHFGHPKASGEGGELWCGRRRESLRPSPAASTSSGADPNLQVVCLLGAVERLVELAIVELAILHLEKRQANGRLEKDQHLNGETNQPGWEPSRAEARGERGPG